MGAHDVFCRCSFGDPGDCQCEMIRAVRLDERARMSHERRSRMLARAVRMLEKYPNSAAARMVIANYREDLL